VMLGMTLSAPFALWLGINLFINLGLPAVISYQPERLRVTYSWARMGMPGEVEVHDLRIVAQGPLDQWALEVDRATAVIDLLPLLDRTFSAHQIRGTGGTLRYRVRIPSADRPPPGAPADDINPPIPELQNPPSPAPEELYAPPNNPWHVALTDVTLDGLREVWFGSVRYEGNSSVSGELAYTLLEHLGVRQAVLKMTDGAITVGGGEMLHGVHGRLDLAIEGMNPAVNAGIEAFGFITAKVSMAGKVQDLRFLDFYLGEVPWVQLTGGEGDLEVEALLDHGRFADGTSLTANVRAVEGHWFDYVARGDALLRLLVSSPAAIPETRITVDFADYAITRDGQTSALVEGEGFRVAARSPDVRLDRPFTKMAFDLDLPEARIPDVAVYNTYLPANLGMKIRGGTGRVRGNVKVSTSERIVSGGLVLTGSNVALSLGQLAVRAQVVLDARLRSGDLDAGVYDMAGTHLTLRGVRLVDAAHDSDDKDDSKAWWADLTLDSARVHAAAREFLVADLRVKMRDTIPIITVVSAQKRIPRWIRGILAIKKVSGTARVRIGDDTLVVPSFKVRAGPFGVKLQARLDHRGTRAHMLLDYGILGLGVDIEGAKTKLHIFSPRRWYASQPPL
jgi:hypothetical protein